VLLKRALLGQCGFDGGDGFFGEEGHLSVSQHSPDVGWISREAAQSNDYILRCEVSPIFATRSSTYGPNSAKPGQLICPSPI